MRRYLIVIEKAGVNLSDVHGTLAAKFVFGGRRGMQSKTIVVATDDQKTAQLSFQCLILDEPLNGADPRQRVHFKRLLQQLAADGRTIVLSSHILEEVDAVCNRAIIIAAGRILADETPKALARRAPSGRLDDVFRQITLGAKPVRAEAANA